MSEAGAPGTTRAVSTPGTSISVVVVAFADQVPPAPSVTASPPTRSSMFGDRDDLDVGRRQLGLRGGTFHGGGGRLDVPHQRRR